MWSQYRFWSTDVIWCQDGVSETSRGAAMDDQSALKRLGADICQV